MMSQRTGRLIAVVSLVFIALTVFVVWGVTSLRNRWRLQSYSAYIWSVVAYAESRSGEGMSAPLRQGLAEMPRAVFCKDLSEVNSSASDKRYEFLDVDLKKVPDGILVIWSAQPIGKCYIGMRTPCQPVLLAEAFASERDKAIEWAAQNNVQTQFVIISPPKR